MIGHGFVCHRLHRLLAPRPRSCSWAHRFHQAAGSNQVSVQHDQNVDVQQPLCRRLAVHQDSLGNLLAWRQKVEAKIDDIGDTFELQDQGPSANDLKREVNWVLEDTVAEVRFSPDKPWEICAWQQLQMEMSVARHRQQDVGSWQVKLRAPVQQLHDWWKLRLEERVPFQYLISTAHWRTYVFTVAPGVLIPRPETEIFPETVEQVLTQQPALAALPWVDLGTGSGAIAISVADVLRKRHKAAQVLAVDISPVAAAHARANAAAAGMSHHVTVLQGSWLEPVLHHLTQPPHQSTTPSEPHETSTTSHSIRQAGISQAAAGCGDTQPQAPHSTDTPRWTKPLLGGIVSNPPYIPRSVMEAGLQAEVGRHEPWLALDGGPGPGLDSLDVICQGAAVALVPGGFLMLETAGREQAETVADRLRADGAFKDVSVVLDCYGVNRFITAYRA